MTSSSKEEAATQNAVVKLIDAADPAGYAAENCGRSSVGRALASQATYLPEVLFDEPLASYHGDRAYLGSTQIKLAESATRFFNAVERGETSDSKSDALRLGSAWHTLKEIGTDLFAERAVTAPEEHCTPGGGLSTKKATKEWLATLPADSIILTPEMGEILGRMKDGFDRNPAAVELEESIVHREVSIRWQSAAGVLVRCRPDCICEGGRLVDWKSTSEANILADFSRSVRTYGYGISAALYEQGCVVSGLAEPPMVFVVTQTVEPYLTQVLTLPPAYMDWARRRLDELLTEIATRRATNDWLEDGYGKVNELTMPGFGGDRNFITVE